MRLLLLNFYLRNLNDIYSPGEMHPLSPNNMLLITFRRSENEATYRNFGEIYYEREYKNGISHTFNIKNLKIIVLTSSLYVLLQYLFHIYNQIDYVTL
jgi:hypothetical protein